ncbi:MAG: Bug family tripartite tricarboxylate transporter substrate binding protein [Burkholderiales bacterium]
MKISAAMVSISLLAPVPAIAQAFPTKPIRLIIPFAPGGGNDILGRQAGQGMSEVLRQQVIADNRGGAGGSIGMELAASAAADGYTLVVGHIGTLAVNPSMDTKLKYDAIKDFAPISLVARLPALMVVNPALPATSIVQFIALAKAKPGTLSYGSGGAGGANHLTTEYFNMLTGIQLIHVPYRSAGLAAIDVIAGQIAMVMPAVNVVLPQVRAGKLRALGVSTEQRLAVAPEIPTIAESGVPEFKVTQWYGILAPANTPKPVINELNRAIVKAMSSPDLRERMQTQGADASVSTPDEFRALIKSELTRWAPVIAAAGLRQ